MISFDTLRRMKKKPLPTDREKLLAEVRRLKEFYETCHICGSDLLPHGPAHCQDTCSCNEDCDHD